MASCFSALLHELLLSSPPRGSARRWPRQARAAPTAHREGCRPVGPSGHRVSRLAHGGAGEAAAKRIKVLPLVRFELTIPRYPPNPPEAGALPLGHRGSPIIKSNEETNLHTVDFECPERMLRPSGSQFTVYNKVDIHLSGSGVRFSQGIEYQKRRRWLLHY